MDTALPPTLKLCVRIFSHLQTVWHVRSDVDCNAAHDGVHPWAQGLTILSSFIQLRACISTVARLLKVACLSHQAACVVCPPNTTDFSVKQHQYVNALASPDVAACATIRGMCSSYLCRLRLQSLQCRWLAGLQVVMTVPMAVASGTTSARLTFGGITYGRAAIDSRVHVHLLW